MRFIAGLAIGTILGVLFGTNLIGVLTLMWFVLILCLVALFAGARQ